MLHILLLPFTIAAGFLAVALRVVINLSRILFRLLMRSLALPLALLKGNLFIVFLIAVAIFVIAQFSSGDKQPPGLSLDPTLTPTQAEPPQAQPARHQPQKPVVIDPVRKREDGNSSFATDLYARMNDQQKAYYSQFFYDSMNRLADGATQQWTNGNTHGSLRVEHSFTNKLGHRCREFSERLKVGDIEQVLTGTGCEKGRGAWCKLKVNATPACNLGGDPGFWEKVKSWF